MSTMIQFGYKASVAELAEKCGFDSVAISDHFQPWRHTNGHVPFSFTWLDAVGARTERIRLGTSVVIPTFRYHPAIVAQAMATLACLCRAACGWGSARASR